MAKIIFLFVFVINIVNGLSINYNNKGLRRYRNSFVFNIGRNIKHDHCPIVDYFETRQKKVDEVERILDQYETIKRVSFFDDSSDNTNEMVNFLKKYREISRRDISFDVAKVEEDGKLIRLPGYRERR